TAGRGERTSRSALPALRHLWRLPAAASGCCELSSLEGELDSRGASAAGCPGRGDAPRYLHSPGHASARCPRTPAPERSRAPGVPSAAELGGGRSLHLSSADARALCASGAAAPVAAEVNDFAPAWGCRSAACGEWLRSAALDAGAAGSGGARGFRPVCRGAECGADELGSGSEGRAGASLRARTTAPYLR